MSLRHQKHRTGCWKQQFNVCQFQCEVLLGVGVASNTGSRRQRGASSPHLPPTPAAAPSPPVSNPGGGLHPAGQPNKWSKRVHRCLTARGYHLVPVSRQQAQVQLLV
jgi:hypothetical protein